MTQKQTGKSRSEDFGERRLLTLSEVAQSIDVSMPTAQKYKRVYQRRIPSVGKGRTQRYPEKALKVFEQIKVENLNRRGRPPKSSGSSAQTNGSKRMKGSSNSKKRSKGAVSSGRAKSSRTAREHEGDLMTLTEISRKTGISYPTCIKYAKENLGIIPHVGSGRQRRYRPEALAVFRDLRNRSRRGRRKAGSGGPSRTEKALLERVRKLESTQRQLVNRLEKMLTTLERPMQVTVKRKR